MTKNCFFRRCLALFFVLLLVVASVPVAPVHAILDPVSIIYPIWQMFGMQAGLTVEIVGGDLYAQSAFPDLFHEWQSYRVYNGLQEAVTSIADFATGLLNVASVSRASGSGGLLHSVLRVGSSFSGLLNNFWNWLIDVKLGGSSVDSTDFDASFGNVSSFDLPFEYIADYVYDNDKAAWNAEATPVVQNSTGKNAYKVTCHGGVVVAFHVGGTFYAFTDTQHADVWLGYVNLNTDSVISIAHLFCDSSFNNVNGLWYLLSNNANSDSWTEWYVPPFDTVEDAIDAFLYTDEHAQDKISVFPEEGIDVLGFPDTSDPDYVPSDAVIPWNIPYDQAYTPSDYLEEAYDKAMDNTLSVADEEAPPISGDDTIGPASDYLVPGLSTVFPFCIPFDIYNFLSALAAEPAAPSFSCTLAFPAQLGGPQTVVIDFDTPVFNQLAQLLRLLELLAFIVGLAFVTRSMFLRG